jgi:antitoxin (DNA-binding transcriptional repressor) of toxin-antitoxin stability system
MITRIPIDDAKNRLSEIIAGLGPDDEALLTDERTAIVARLLPVSTADSENKEVTSRDEQWQQAFHRLTTRYEGSGPEVSIDRESFYE